MKLLVLLFLSFISLMSFADPFGTQRTPRPIPQPRVMVPSDELARELSARRLSSSQIGRQRIGGDREGNGGSGMKAEVLFYLDEVLTLVIANLPVGHPLHELSSSMHDRSKQSRISCGMDLVLRGSRVDAINYPSENSVVFDCPRWQHLNVIQRRLLVLHEFVYISGHDDSDYYLSKLLLEVFNRYKTISIQDSQALHFAALHCELEIFNKTVEYADINTVGPGVFSTSPLAKAMLTGCNEIASQLTDMDGAFIHLENERAFATLFMQALLLAEGQSPAKLMRGNMRSVDYLRYLSRSTETGVFSLNTPLLVFDTCHAKRNPGLYPSKLLGRLNQRKCGQINLARVIATLRIQRKLETMNLSYRLVLSDLLTTEERSNLR